MMVFSVRWYLVCGGIYCAVVFSVRWYLVCGGI